MNSFRRWHGNPYPPGTTWDGAGTTFALFSEHGEKVELCLFDPADPPREIARRRLMEKTDHPSRSTRRGKSSRSPGVHSCC